MTHDVHGMAGNHEPAQWPALRLAEVRELLSGYADIGAPQCITWHSPRPLSAACLVQCANTSVFVKRHHCSVRTVATLHEEHRFIDHLHTADVPVPVVLRDTDGRSARAIGDWVYEVHTCAAGVDVYRETISWVPLANLPHAHTAGAMLARLHTAAADYHAPQRDTHILVARSELLCATDPIAALQAQLPQRPQLASYLRQRDWQTELAAVLAPWHPAAQPRLAQQARCWTHGDWHVSNLCWSSADDDAHITAVVDFGLAAATFALFDLATAIERNAIGWLHLEQGLAAAHADIARALIAGYRQQRALDAAAVHLLGDLLPLVHLDFALSEVEYFNALPDRHKPDMAWTTFLRGHAAWFSTAAGRALLRAIHDCA
jgi:Ser/Thr protein kinase RdoA (MazF antagonist)